MPRTPLIRLIDIRDAISGIHGVIANAPFKVFAENWGMQRAIERGLEIISEASRHLPADLTELALRFHGDRSRLSAIYCVTNISVPTSLLRGTSSKNIFRLWLWPSID